MNDTEENVRYLPFLVEDYHGNSWPLVGLVGALAWSSSMEGLPLTSLHMEVTNTQHLVD